MDLTDTTKEKDKADLFPTSRGSINTAVGTMGSYISNPECSAFTNIKKNSGTGGPGRLEKIKRKGLETRRKCFRKKEGGSQRQMQQRNHIGNV